MTNEEVGFDAANCKPPLDKPPVSRPLDDEARRVQLTLGDAARIGRGQDGAPESADHGGSSDG